MTWPSPLTMVGSGCVAREEDLATDMLLDGIRTRYGYDFTHYSRASLKRRLGRMLAQTGLTNLPELLDRLLHEEQCFDEFIKLMSITVTEMFRDPAFYRAVREHVIPALKTYPFAKIWHAGCATGEEVYSMALLLHEENFLDRVRIYATDFNKHSLDAASNGVYSARQIEAYAANYREAGGKKNFHDYLSDGYELAKFKDFLKERTTFSYHNLVTDGVFGEMNIICCRNVLIYFDKTLQDQVLRKFTESLRHGGFLCLGNKESLNFTAVKSLFEPVDKGQRIYRKCGV
jgi:chemotaxis protein methyltransferase CheR